MAYCTSALLLAALIATKASRFAVCEGFFVVSKISSKTRSSPRSSGSRPHCPDTSNNPNTRTRFIAFASFDFFTPVDDFYDDVDDLYKSRDYGTDNESDGNHQVHWLDPEMKGLKSLGEAIADGETVVSIPGMADVDECLDLVSAGVNACQMQNGGQTKKRGRNRFSVSDPAVFDSDNVVLLCEEILLRVLDYLDENVPSVYETLFRPGDDWLRKQPLNAQLEQPSVPPPEYLAELCGSIRELYLMGELEWSEGEPAINVYESEGYFGSHKDHLALTVLIPLTSPGKDFTGGGTGYWRGNRQVDEKPQTPPDLVLTPKKGTALVFGGDITHSGIPVRTGSRSVFVCSFSTRTPASHPNRLHGMHVAPEVSANFKGTY